MNLGVEAHGLIPGLLVFSAVMVLPIKWAAVYVDAGRTDFMASFIAAILSLIFAVVGFKLMGGGLAGFLVGSILMNVVQAIILKVSVSKVPGYFIIAIFLQIAIGLALASSPIKF